MKLTYEEKVKIYNEHLSEGHGPNYLARKYGLAYSHLKYMFCLADRYGIEVLKHSKNKYYSKEFKEEAINRSLLGKESINEISLDLCLPNRGTLVSWVKDYINNGYNVVIRKRGKPRARNKDEQGATREKTKGNRSRESKTSNRERILKKIKYLNSKKRKPTRQEVIKAIYELRLEIKDYSLKEILSIVNFLEDIPYISRSDYYYNVSSKDKDLKNDELMNKIIDIYYHHKNRYGYRRIALTLKRYGYSINHKKVYRLMKKMNLQGIKKRKISKYSSYKGEIGKVAPNIIKRNFFSNSPNTKWYTDITEFNVRDSKLYLSPIIDGYAGDIVSYTLSTKPTLKDVLDMVKIAIKDKDIKDKLILHSDQGWQYQHSSYQILLKKHGIKQSMSRKGNSPDNGLIENFFGLLKTEMYYGQENTYSSIDELSKAIEDYIYYYNNERIKERLKGLTPIEYRNQSLLVK